MADIRASLTVAFTADGGDQVGSGFMKLEVDGRDDGLNGGDTNFSPLDNAFILLFTGANVKLNSIITTDGSLATHGAGTVAVSDHVVSFNNTREVQLPYPASSSVALSKVGSVFNSSNNSITGNPVLQSDKVTLRFSEPVTGNWKASYSAPYKAYRLFSVKELATIVALGTAS